MLTAITETGKKLSLGHYDNKEELKILRKREKFFCPVCMESVMLKLGEQRIPHFSHKKGSNCEDFYERESIYHMEGKLQLFRWLIRQNIPAELEFYDKEIKQRPDIMFLFNGKKYALEYQCSIIPEPEFVKRTSAYINHGYDPIWIMGDKQFRNKHGNVLTLSNFDYLFIRKQPGGLAFIPAYCPDKQLFHFIDCIFSYSPQKALVHHTFTSQMKVGLNGLLSPKPIKQFQIGRWVQAAEKYNMQWSLRPNLKQQSFLKELYRHQLNFYLLPPEIGLPIRHAFLFQTPPIIWQSYLFIDILLHKTKGQIISLRDFQLAIERRICQNDIIIRSLPALKEVSWFEAVREYLHVLEQLGILQREDEVVFQLKRKMMVPASNKEKAKLNLLFMKENLQILSKT